MGAVTRDGFKAMVDYTAPVFWGFMLLVGISIFILRKKHPERILPYKVPFYPLTPLLFCLTCLYMFYSSVMYTGVAALIGLGVLIAGTPILLFKFAEPEDQQNSDPEPDITIFKVTTLLEIR